MRAGSRVSGSGPETRARGRQYGDQKVPLYVYIGQRRQEPDPRAARPRARVPRPTPRTGATPTPHGYRLDSTRSYTAFIGYFPDSTRREAAWPPTRPPGRTAQGSIEASSFSLVVGELEK